MQDILRQGKRALITGASRGLGAYLAQLLAALGAEVSREALARDFGPVDIPVNNAGLGREGPALTHAEEEWDAVFDSNLKGRFSVAQGTGPRDAPTRGRKRQQRSVGTRFAAGKWRVVQCRFQGRRGPTDQDTRARVGAPQYSRECHRAGLYTDINRDFWQTDAGKALISRIPQRRLSQLQDLDGPLLLLTSDASRCMTGAVIAVARGHLVNML